MKKLFDKIPIRSTKDWIIAGLFTALIVYCITMYFTSQIDEFMLWFVPHKLSRLNIPKSYGNLMITILFMTILVTFVLIMKKKSIKQCALTFCIGMILSISIFGSFKIHCNFIVNTAFTKESTGGRVSTYTDTENKQISLKAGDERLKKLVSLANSVVEMSKEEQDKLRDYIKNVDYDLSVWITFPTAFGYEYDMVFKTIDDYIIFNNGYYENNYHFFKDNGLINYANELLNSSDSK